MFFFSFTASLYCQTLKVRFTIKKHITNIIWIKKSPKQIHYLNNRQDYTLNFVLRVLHYIFYANLHILVREMVKFTTMEHKRRFLSLTDTVTKQPPPLTVSKLLLVQLLNVLLPVHSCNLKFVVIT